MKEAFEPEKQTVIAAETSPDGTMIISEERYYGSEDLQDIMIEEGVSVIEAGAFAACENLRSVSFPSTLTEICEGAFMYCPRLAHVEMPSSLRKIGDAAFLGCTSLTEATVSSPDCMIGSYAFGGYYHEAPERGSLDFSMDNDAGGSALIKGRFPAHFPEEAEYPEKLMYSLLWCLDRQSFHEQADEFLKAEPDAAFYYALSMNRRDILEALLAGEYIPEEKAAEYVRASNNARRPEFAGLLLHSAAGRGRRNIDEEFAI